MKGTVMRTEIMQMSNDELNELTRLIKTRREILSLEAKSMFAVGDKVTFIRKSGTVYIGVIYKVNRKRIDVKTDKGRWNVPPTMLTLIKGE